jgi:CRP-like cAMP-binding protein
MLSPDQPSPPKTGPRPVQLTVRTVKPSEKVFSEGTKGSEMYIVQDGRLGVYKTSGGAEIEIGRVEKGAVIGEMPLVSMTHATTVKAIDQSTVLVIDEQTFQNALSSVPIWLRSIIRVVASRLRDEDRRLDQAVLRDRERGLLTLVLLMLPSQKHEFASAPALDYESFIREAYFVCRLKKTEIVKILSGFEKRGILSIVQDAAQVKHLCIADLEVLGLYEEYLTLKGQNKTFKELTIPEESMALLGNIAYVAQKSGVETGEVTSLLKSVLLHDLEVKNTDQLEKNLLDLKRRSLINLMPSGSDSMIIFKKQDQSRVKKMKEWMSRFEMETP